MDNSLQAFPNTMEVSMTFGLAEFKKFFVNSFLFPEKILFHTHKIATIESPNPVPHLNTSECFEIHNPHSQLCDLLL